MKELYELFAILVIVVISAGSMLLVFRNLNISRYSYPHCYHLVSFLLSLVVFKQYILVILPLTVSFAFFPDLLSSSPSINSTEFLVVGFLDNFSLILWSILYVKLLKVFTRISSNKYTRLLQLPFDSVNLLSKGAYIPLLLISVFTIPVNLLLVKGALFGSSNLPFIFDFFKSLTLYSGPCFSILFLFHSFLSTKFLLFRIFGLVPLAVNLLILDSTRYSLLYTLFVLCFLYFQYIPKSNTSLMNSIKKTLSVATLFLSIYFLIGSLPKVTLNTLTGEISFITQDVKRSADRNPIQEYIWRSTASYRYSTAFIAMQNENKQAGLAPSNNSLLGIIPRSLNPNKPHPGVVDPDNKLDSGMYRIYTYFHPSSFTTMVEPVSAAHAYWELGFLWVLSSVLISSLVVAFFTTYLSSCGVIGIPLLFAIFKPFGYTTPFLPVPDTITLVYQIIFPLLLISFVIKAFSLIKKSIVRSTSC